MVPIDPLIKTTYLNNGPGNFIQMAETCYNSSAVYVICPELLCGTKVETTAQLLRDVRRFILSSSRSSLVYTALVFFYKKI